MTTAYSPSRAANTSAPLTHSATRYSGAAELCAAIRAAAVVAPEVAPQIQFMERYSPSFYPFTVPAEWETGEGFVMSPRVHLAEDYIGVTVDGPASKFPRNPIHPESMGPYLPLPSDARVSFAYALDGARGSLTVANTAPALRALADKVHGERGAFDGKARRAKKPAKPAGSAPHVAARAAWKAGDFEGAINFARGVGHVVFGKGGVDKPAIPYMGAAHVRAAGEDWVIARCIQTGEFLALHLDCGLSVGGRFKSHSAALDALESSATEEAWQAKVAAAVSTLPKFSQTQALAHYLGADEDESAAIVAPVEPVPTVCATTAPLSAALLAHVDASAPVDLFDYLADYATEPTTPDAKTWHAMRAAVLADIERTGEALYWSRVAEESTPVPTQPAPDADYRESEEFRDLRYGNEIATREKADIERAASDSATRARLLSSAAARYAVSAEGAPSVRLARSYRQVSFALGICAQMCGDAADAEIAPLVGLDVIELDAVEAAQAITQPPRDPMPWPKPVARVLPPVRIGRMDPRIRIPARFTPGYALRG